MSYTPNQKLDHIRELQEMLGDLSYKDSRLFHIVPDGIYGKETAEAVKAYQQTRGLRPTGEANHATWNALAAEHYGSFGSEAKRLRVFPVDRELIAEGDSGLAVFVVQAMLQELSRVFGNVPAIAVTGFYDQPTKDAVRSFRLMSGNTDDDRVDRDTWNSLTGITEHITG